MQQSYSDLWRLIRVAKPSPILLLAATVAAVLSAAATLWFPILTRQLIDDLGAGERGSSGVALVASTLLGATFLGALSAYLLARAGHQLVACLRGRLVQRILALPVGAFDGRDTGERVSRVMSDCESISELATKQIVGLLTGTLLLVGSIVVLLLLDTGLTITLIGSIAGAFAIIVPVALLLEGLSRQVQDGTARLSGLLTHMFSEIRLVKAFTAEQRELSRANKEIGGLRRLGIRVARINVALEPLINLAITVAIVIILVYGALRVSSGEMTVGTLMAFILYMFNVATPLVQLTSFTAELQKAKGASSRISLLLQEPEEGSNSTTRFPLPGQDLVFDAVSFSYGDRRRQVVSDIDVCFQAGTTTALVGLSGSGKTTILSLIERFYEPSSGLILYGDVPLTEFSLAAWRRSIGYVAQSAPIMPGTVRDNIVYGLIEPCSDDALRDAAKKAGALEFIEAMPLGFDTVLSEQGGNLSGGQRQRIAIARLFLRSPSILILDEATSSLDSETERQVKDALEELMRGRTNIVVAHRLSTVMDADQICFLEDGRITGVGNHGEMISTHAYYARLVEQQRLEPQAALEELSKEPR